MAPQEEKKLRFYKRWGWALCFGVKNNWHIAILVALVVVGVASVYYFGYLRPMLPSADATELVLTALSRLSVVLTLVVAILLGLSEMAQSWENSLPKRLTVKFVYRDSDCEMVCRHAYLAHEADIRNWGQQIGRQMASGQMASGQNLAFDPNLEMEVGKPASIKGEKFKPYTVTFMLTKKPDLFEKHKKLRRVVWEYDFCSKRFHKNCVVVEDGEKKTISCQEMFVAEANSADASA